jgi:hypothetical protein
MPNYSNVKESIDERILRLLGLEDVFDLDYDTYLTLLKEELVKSRMTQSKIPTEEIELLTDEYKRVKSKKGRFEVKKKTKITADKLGVKRQAIKISKQKMLSGVAIKALPSASIAEKTQEISKKNLLGGGDLEKNVVAIRSSIDSIYNILGDQLLILVRGIDEERKRRESESRSAREKGLEKRFEVLKKVADKLLAPIKSILSSIIDFFVKMILGRALMKLIDWMADPKNKGKIHSIFRFLKDWWPALLGAYIIFGTSLGRFASGLIAKIGLMLLRLTRFAIPGLLKFIARNPIVGGAALAVGSLVAANEITGQRKAAPVQAENKIKAQTGKGIGVQGVGGVGDMGATTPYGLLQGAAQGGLMRHFVFGGSVSGNKGVDKIPAMLSDGEFVMSRGAVSKFGVPFLETLNAAGGGNNRPKIMGGVPHAAGGGLIGNSSGFVGKEKEAYDYLLQKGSSLGLKPHHVAGIVGNLSLESMGVNPNQKQLGGGAGRGIAQWETHQDGNGRWDLAEKWWKSKGNKDSLLGNLRGQLDYLLYELKTGNPLPNGSPAVPYGSQTLPTLLKAKDVTSATQAFLSAYEAPDMSAAHVGQRIANAQRISNSVGTIKLQTSTIAESKPNFLQNLGNFANSLFGISPAIAKSRKKQSGGFINGGLSGKIGENTGVNIPGATADRQGIFVQPGEYVIPKLAVDRIGSDSLDRIVSLLDPNSSAARIGKRSPNMRIGVNPPVQNQPKVIYTSSMPSAGSDQPISRKTQHVPRVDAQHPSGTRSRKTILGII